MVRETIGFGERMRSSKRAERSDYTLLVKDEKNRKQFSITSPAAQARDEEWNAVS